MIKSMKPNRIIPQENFSGVARPKKKKRKVENRHVHEVYMWFLIIKNMNM